MQSSDKNLTWSTRHRQGNSSLAHQFPSFQINAPDTKGGNVRVEARAPSGRVHDMGVVDNSGVFTANFTPTEVGDWLISILYEGQNIQGSPFNVRVYDASMVKVFGLEGGSVGNNFNFSVDTSGAGEGQLTVDITHNGRTIPAQIRAEAGNRFLVNFTPEGGGIYNIRVFFAGMEVAGSPYTLEIVDSASVSASGEGLSSVEVNRRAVFIVNTGQRGSGGDIRVNITSPRGVQLPAQVHNNGDGTFRVEYLPNDVGEYMVDVYYYGKPIGGSPYRVHGFDFNRITVRDLKPSGMVGKPVEFSIDAQHAGAGNLEIMVNEGTIPCSVKNRGNRQFNASFAPKEPGTHLIQIKFNGKEVSGSPWRVDVGSMAHMSAGGPGLQVISAGKTAMFEVRTGSSDGNVQVNITSPSGRQVPCNVVNLHNGIYRIEYHPSEVGTYVIDVLYETIPIPGSPFMIKSYDVRGISLSPIAPGVVGQSSEFTIDVTQAGEGQLEIMVNRGAVPNSVHMLSKGVFEVSFVPRDCRPHQVDIKFNGEPIPGTPVMVPVMDSSRVTVQGDGLSQVVVNRQSHFRVNTHAAGEADLQVRVTSPSGELVPAKIVQQPDGDYKVEYSSRFTGRHTVEILYAGQPIMGSPFHVEIYDPSKIRVEGTRGGMVGNKVEFDIIRADAGRAELALTITSPSNRSVHYDMSPITGGDHVTYMPTEPGCYQIFITYGGLDVQGCPIKQDIIDSSTATAHGDGLERGVEDKSSTFYVDAKGHRGDLVVQVEGPNSIAKCNIEPDSGGRYVVNYVPVEVGTYKVSIKWNGREIEGSPFHPKIVDPRKVRVVGGWESILTANNCVECTVNETRRIEFDTREAGPGQLGVKVEGPAGAVPCNLQYSASGTYVLTFVPNCPGEHRLSVFWNDELVPRSPVLCMVRAAKVVTSSANHEKVILTGHGLREAKVNEEAEFVIDGTDAGPGVPHVRLTGVKSDIDVDCRRISDNKYRCLYTPQYAGAYLLNIQWSDRQVRGSPFKVNVSSGSDASRVMCKGEGLQMGVMGREITATIDTRRAGPGELTAHCMGPTKVAYCELLDHRDGTFTLHVKPQEPGKHVLQVKFGDEHVPGSPYMLKIAGAPDASKVRVNGPGIEHGILATYQSHFLVETKGAGAGQLTVRIRGPKGAFRVEMQRESQRDRNILCRYDPTEVGDYFISIRWSNEPVPGSPFQVHIFDTQYELDRFLMENPNRRRNATGALTNRAWNEDL